MMLSYRPRVCPLMDALLPISELTSGDNMELHRQDPIIIILFITSEFAEATGWLTI